MSRDQRRANRRQQARAGAPAGGGAVNRRTPVRAPGSSGPPWAVIGVFGGIAAVIALIAYLIIQSATGGEGGLSAAEKAELDDSPDLPGVFIATQGRAHANYTYSPDREPRPYCEDVLVSDSAATPTIAATSGTPTATATPTRVVPTPTTISHTQTGNTSPAAGARTDCYASNPPSSGQHLNVFSSVDLGDGISIRIPPDPDTYPDDVAIPREAIPHILEHAGVFVGYNCAEGDEACAGVVEDLTDLVDDRIDNHNERVVMARFPDLPEGSIGLSSWTRVLNMPTDEYDEDAVRDFIDTHNCRFDPEGFCR